MKIFTKKSFMKKIAIICLFLILFNFSGINQVHANNDGWGGKLLASTVSLFVAISDSIYSVTNKFIMGNSYFDALVGINTTTGVLETIAKVIVAGIRYSCRNCYRLPNSRNNCSRSNVSYRFLYWSTDRWRDT